jgi:hypothetical protein
MQYTRFLRVLNHFKKQKKTLSLPILDPLKIYRLSTVSTPGELCFLLSMADSAAHDKNRSHN